MWWWNSFCIDRKKYSINGSAELIHDESGQQLYLASRSRNQFLQFREMFLGIHPKKKTTSWGKLWHAVSQPVKNHYHSRFSFGSGEWRNGAETWQIGPCSSCRSCRSWGVLSNHYPVAVGHAISKEAQEITSDPERRWFAFNMEIKSILIMERKGMPTHLQSLACVDNPTELGVVLRQLQDAGEVWIAWNYIIIL